MDKETLSNYGWVVVCVLVLAVMIALATPFGNFVASAVENTAESLFGASQKAMNTGLEDFGITVKDQEMGSTNSASKEELPNEIIPEGGTYLANWVYDKTTHTSSYTVLTAGNEFPKPQKGDMYIYGEYEYCYGYTPDGYLADWPQEIKSIMQNGGLEDYVIDGWGVRFVGSSQAPEPIIDSINHIAITNLDGTYAFTNIEVAPTIPKTITSMISTYAECRELTTAPVLTEGIEKMCGTFMYCERLTLPPEIPSSVKDMSNAFFGCWSMEKLPTLHKGVEILDGTFAYCTGLLIEGYDGAITSTQNSHEYIDFSYYKIPSTVTSMVHTFKGSIIEGIPEIPSSVKSAEGVFGAQPDAGPYVWNAYVFNEGVENLSGAFERVNIYADITVPKSAKDISRMFFAITTYETSRHNEYITIYINHTPENYAYCFSAVDFSKYNIRIEGNCEILDEIGATGSNYCKTCNGTCKKDH